MNSTEIDLHIHSYFSDGTMSPREILMEAIQKKLKLISITDHNVLEGSKELSQISNGIIPEIISGVEIDTLDSGINYHILGYGFDIENKRFNDFVRNTYNVLESINVKLISLMEKDYPNISLQEYSDYTYDRRGGFWKALHYFRDKGLITQLKDGKKFFGQYGPFYTVASFPTIQEACKEIHDAGGIAILAHPGRVLKNLDLTEFEREVRRVATQGIDGIESYYPTHSKEVIDICNRICNEFDLQITAGADCHGEVGETKIGENSSIQGNVSFNMNEGKKVDKKFSYDEILKKISEVLEIGKLDKKVNLTGGIVPWIVLNENSERGHSDIDFFVNSKEMPYIRRILRKRGLYEADLDTFSDNNGVVDYGLDTTIEGVPVSFFPYEVLENNGGVVQRSFYTDAKTGTRGYREMYFNGIKEQDYVSEISLPNGRKIGIISLEVLKLLKEKSNRPKDVSDIAAIDRAGIDNKRYLMLKNSMNINNTKNEFRGRIRCDVSKNKGGTQNPTIETARTAEKNIEGK